MINKRFPLVLMLEPLHACNLTCTGCGRIREYESTITRAAAARRMPDGGGRVRRAHGFDLRRRAACCIRRSASWWPEFWSATRTFTSAPTACSSRKRLKEFTPDRRFFFNVHLDGMEKNHDICVEREGVFREAIEGIKAAKAAGFMVCTNTTVYKETDMKEIGELFEYLEQFDVDGHQISPAYGYSAVNDREIFMTRDDIHEKFKDIDKLSKRFRLNQTPMYLEFLKGERDLPCTAWGNPTYNVKGWKGPCYLITDGHYNTFEALMTKTPWENYGTATIRAASIAWCIAAMSRRRRWESMRSWRTASRC